MKLPAPAARTASLASGLLVAALLAAAPPVRAAASDPIGHPRLVRVALDERVGLRQLLEAGLDVVEVHGTGEAMVYEWPWQESVLPSLGARAEVVDPDPGATAAARARREIAGRPRPAGARVWSATRSDGRYRLESLPPFGSGSMGGFWTLDEVKMKLDSLVASDIQDLVADKLDTLGYSRQNRPIWGLEIGKHVTGPDPRPVVFYNALTHAREPEGMEALFYFVDDLLSGYGTDPWKTYLLDHRRIYICPVVNPDGYQINVNTYVNTGGSSFGNWRKNARDNNGNLSFDSADGVDLNRNYGFAWGFNNVGSSPTTTSDIYRGPSAFSEPETQAQRDKVAALQPATALSFHTYSDLWLHPWGYQVTGAPDSSAFYEWNDEAMAGIGYMAGQGIRVLYEVNGEFNDWCYGETVLKPRIISWTPEVGSSNDGFWPPPSRIEPLARENLRGCYMVDAIAGPYVRIERQEVTGGALLIGNFGNIEVFARNLGRTSTGTGLHANMVSLDPGAEVLSGSIGYPTLASRSSGAPNGGATFLVGTADTLTPGRLIRFRVEFRDDDGLYCRDTVEVPAGQPTVLLNDPATSTANFNVTAGWGTVSNDPVHPSRYFADSPAGKYPASANSRMILKTRLNLSPGFHAYAYFDSRWSFEGDFDGCLVEASFDSVTWIPAAGRATTAGTVGAQPVGKPIYEGQRYNWRTERVDLSPFCGPTATAVRFRLRTVSDGGTEFDGMNLDSLRILLYDPATQPAPVAVAPQTTDRFEFDPPAPNPASRRTTFAWALPRAGPAKLEVLDLAGRRVALLADGTFGPNRYVRGWDLAGEDGRPIHPGVYFARLSTTAGMAIRRFVVLR